MRRIILIPAALAVAALAARPVAAAFFTGCCACVAGENVTTSGPPAPAPVPALLCAQVAGMAGPAFAQQCDQAGGNNITCEEPVPGMSCTQTLAEAGFTCPVAPGVPAAGRWGLIGLLAALGALGTGVLRRRAR
ncbi:MAG: hypothetical protein U0802_24015 [Candidatus Binatia bacterium]